MTESENRTEMEYLELAKHAKDTMEIKDQEIKRISWELQKAKIAIRKMGKIIENIHESTKKMDNLINFSRGNIGNMMKFFYSQFEDCNMTNLINLDDFDSLSSSTESELSDEEEEIDSLSLGTILDLLGESRGALQPSRSFP